MHILLITLGTRGDINPFICLGKQLKALGYEVTIISSEIYHDLVRSVGMNFISCSAASEYDAVINDSHVYDARKSFKVVANYLSLTPLRKLYNIISQFDPSNTILVATSFMLGARIANEKLNIPLVSICLQPMAFWSIEETPVYAGTSIHKLSFFFRKLILNLIDRWMIDKLFSRELNQFRSELGLHHVRNIYSKWMFSSQKNIGLFPEWFAKPASDWPKNTELTGFLHCDDENSDHAIPEELIHFLRAGSPPIILTYGTGTTQCEKFYNIFIEAARKLNQRVLVLTQYPDQLPLLNSNREMHASYVPLQIILPHAAAIIHHGGIGTLSRALSASIPQLIVPLAHDQYDNAARLEKLGAGLSLPAKKYSVNTAIKKINELLNSEKIRSNCLLYSKKINYSQAIEQTCRVIESVKQSQ